MKIFTTSLGRSLRTTAAGCSSGSSTNNLYIDAGQFHGLNHSQIKKVFTDLLNGERDLSVKLHGENRFPLSACNQVTIIVGPASRILTEQQSVRDLLYEASSLDYRLCWRISRYYDLWKLPQDGFFGEYEVQKSLCEFEAVADVWLSQPLRKIGTEEELRQIFTDTVGPNANALEWGLIISHGPGYFKRKTLNAMIRFKSSVIDIPSLRIVEGVDRALKSDSLGIEEAAADPVKISLLESGLMILSPVSHQCVIASPFSRCQLEEYADSLSRVRLWRRKLKSIFKT